MSGFPRVQLSELVIQAKNPVAPSSTELVWNLNLDQIESHSGRVLGKEMVSIKNLGPSTYFFERGTLLYSKLRPYLNKVVVADATGFATTELVPLRCKPDMVCPVYLAHYLRSPEFLQFANMVVAGAKMPRMVMSEFWKYEAPLPPLPEQRRIAAILDQADALRAKRREALAQLDRLRQSLFLDMFGDPNRNERGWRLVALETLCEAIWDIDHKMPKSVEEGMPFISAKDLVEYGEISFSDIKRISAEDFKHLSKKGLPSKGDIIYSRIGVNLGKARMVAVDFPFLASYSCCTIRPNERVVDRQYLCDLLDSPSLLKQAHRGIRGIAVPDLGMGEIRNFKIILPPLPLQQAYAKRIQAIEALKANHRAALAELDALFTALQHRAFRGEL